MLYTSMPSGNDLDLGFQILDAYMPLFTDCMAGKVFDCAQEEGTDPDRLLLKRDMICRLRQPEPPHPDGKLPEMRLFCIVNNLQCFLVSHHHFDITKYSGLCWKALR